mmetsp:Transcript_12519/g.35172  ORF Transcript_12519/g.35172 Transcript_12519/m.35172 type:complete len:318 (+) Transcript_12519:778-1731(+)
MGVRAGRAQQRRDVEDGEHRHGAVQHRHGAVQAGDQQVPGAQRALVGWGTLEVDVVRHVASSASGGSLRHVHAGGMGAVKPHILQPGVGAIGDHEEANFLVKVYAMGAAEALRGGGGAEATKGDALVGPRGHVQQVDKAGAVAVRHVDRGGARWDHGVSGQARPEGGPGPGRRDIVAPHQVALEVGLVDHVAVVGVVEEGPGLLVADAQPVGDPKGQRVVGAQKLPACAVRVEAHQRSGVLLDRHWLIREVNPPIAVLDEAVAVVHRGRALRQLQQLRPPPEPELPLASLYMNARQGARLAGREGEGRDGDGEGDEG